MVHCSADDCNETGRYAVGNNDLPLWLCREHYVEFNDLYSDKDPLPV